VACAAAAHPYPSSHPGYVDLSVVNGEPVIHDGRLLTCDLDQLLEEHASASARVCAAVGPPDLAS